MSLRRGEIGSDSINREIVASRLLDSYAVADLPTAADSEGMLVYCSNGAAGSPCLAYCNGTAWLRIALGAAVAAA